MKPLGMPHWSASRFLCWDQCPAEFYSRYVAGHAEDPTEAMLFGSAVHQGLEEHHRGGDGERAFRAAWKAAVEERLLGQADPKLAGVGLALVEGVAALRLQGVPEWAFRLNTELVWGCSTVGAVDLVGKDAVYDFKTTTGAWSKARADREVWQPALYSWAVSEAFGDWPRRFVYVVLNKVSRRVDLFAVERPQTRWAGMYDRARAIALKVEAGEFACHGRHGPCPECGARWEHAHACDLAAAPPRIRLGGGERLSA